MRSEIVLRKRRFDECYAKRTWVKARPTHARICFITNVWCCTRNVGGVPSQNVTKCDKHYQWGSGAMNFDINYGHKNDREVFVNFHDFFLIFAILFRNFHVIYLNFGGISLYNIVIFNQNQWKMWFLWRFFEIILHNLICSLKRISLIDAK